MSCSNEFFQENTSFTSNRELVHEASFRNKEPIQKINSKYSIPSAQEYENATTNNTYRKYKKDQNALVKSSRSTVRSSASKAALNLKENAVFKTVFALYL